MVKTKGGREKIEFLPTHDLPPEHKRWLAEAEAMKFAALKANFAGKKEAGLIASKLGFLCEILAGKGRLQVEVKDGEKVIIASQGAMSYSYSASKDELFGHLEAEYERRATHKVSFGDSFSLFLKEGDTVAKFVVTAEGKTLTSEISLLDEVTMIALWQVVSKEGRNRQAANLGCKKVQDLAGVKTCGCGIGWKTQAEGPCWWCGHYR